MFRLSNRSPSLVRSTAKLPLKYSDVVDLRLLIVVVSLSQLNVASASSDHRTSTPPPIPPRPLNVKMNGSRPTADSVSRIPFHQRFHPATPPLLPPPLPPTDALLLAQRSSTKTSRPLSSASSSESLNDSLGKRQLQKHAHHLEWHS